MNKILQLIQATNGRFFKVVFTKRTNGERREMVARIGVKKDIVGTGLKFSPAKRNLRVVYSTGDRGYRMIPLDAVLSLECGNLKWRAE